jgi:hypothetical protein
VAVTTLAVAWRSTNQRSSLPAIATGAPPQPREVHSIANELSTDRSDYFDGSIPNEYSFAAG